MTLVSMLILAATLVAQAPASSSSPLPSSVRTSFEKAYPGATISSTTPERDGDQTRYRVDAIHQGKRRSILYDASGAVVETAEQVEEKDLPPPVAAAMHSHPRAIYASGIKVTRGSSVEYRLTLRGTRKTAMVAKPDGTVISFK